MAHKCLNNEVIANNFNRVNFYNKFRSQHIDKNPAHIHDVQKFIMWKTCLEKG